MLTSTTDIMTTLLAAVAGISLLVGGIGIHEYHVRERDGAYAGDRPPYEYRCERHGYLGSVLDRVYPYQRDRGLIGVLFGVGAALIGECRGAFPDLYPAMERTALFRGMYRHRGVLRMVSR
mgnify:CR=1 FL=1